MIRTGYRLLHRHFPDVVANSVNVAASGYVTFNNTVTFLLPVGITAAKVKVYLQVYDGLLSGSLLILGSGIQLIGASNVNPNPVLLNYGSPFPARSEPLGSGGAGNPVIGGRVGSHKGWIYSLDGVAKLGYPFVQFQVNAFVDVHNTDAVNAHFLNTELYVRYKTYEQFFDTAAPVRLSSAATKAVC